MVYLQLLLYSPCLSPPVQPAQVDIVYVANIHPKHYETVMMMFEAGKPVLCEKPLTMNASDTKKLIQAARDKGVFFMEVV